MRDAIAMTDSLMTFTSHVAGKNAEVSIYTDRVEWQRKSRLRGSASEMVPLRSVTSVSAKRDGLTHHKVVLMTAAGEIELRCSKGEAEQAKALIQQQMLS